MYQRSSGRLSGVEIVRSRLGERASGRGTSPLSEIKITRRETIRGSRGNGFTKLKTEETMNV